MNFFGIFFQINFSKNCIFWVLVEENQEAFSEKCSLISGVLQGIVKTCKKYMEGNLAVILYDSTCRQCIVCLSLLVVFAEGNLLEWGQFFSGAIILRGNCL